MSTPRHPVIALFAAAIVVAGGLAGCSTKKTLQPNVAPTTRLFVQYDAADGLPHTVHHIVHLHWFGSDPDGYVVGYDYRFIWPGPGQPANPPWIRTTRTDSVFIVPDTTGFSNPTFEVRAVDDHGLVDPSPPRQDFSFSNLAPTVTLSDPPRANEFTIGTQTLDWVGLDPDGDAALLRYRVWLSGHAATPHETTGTEFTFPTSDFMSNGHFEPTHQETAFVQAIDPGGRASNPVFAVWQARPPVSDLSLTRGKLLLVDNLADAVDPSQNYETYFKAAIQRSLIPAGTWTAVSVDSGRPFRSTLDLEQTMLLYDAVVWFRGGSRYSATFDTLLVQHADAIGDYLDHGRKLYLESLDLVAAGTTPGLFDETFLRRYLGCDFVYRRPVGIGSPDSTVEWSIPIGFSRTLPAIVHSTLLDDSLQMNQSYPGLRLFGVRDSNDVVLWARDSTLSQRQRFSAPLAVRAPAGGTGEVIMSSIPLFGTKQADGNRFIDKIFARLGIVP